MSCILAPWQLSDSWQYFSERMLALLFWWFCLFGCSWKAWSWCLIQGICTDCLSIYNCSGSYFFYLSLSDLSGLNRIYQFSSHFWTVSRSFWNNLKSSWILHNSLCNISSSRLRRDGSVSVHIQVCSLYKQGTEVDQGLGEQFVQVAAVCCPRYILALSFQIFLVLFKMMSLNCLLWHKN